MWKKHRRKGESRQGLLVLYIPNFVFVTFPKILGSVPETLRDQARSELLEEFLWQTVVIGGAIAATRPDTVPAIFRECSNEAEKLMRVARSELASLLDLEQDIKSAGLKRLSHAITRQAFDRLTKSDISKGLDVASARALEFVVLFACMLGYDHPELFWDMLRRDLQVAVDKIPLRHLALNMVTLYYSVLNDEDRRTLEDYDGLAHLHREGALPEKLVTVYQRIAPEIVANYERAFGPL